MLRPSAVKAYLQLLRFPNVFTAIADVLMGFFLTHAWRAEPTPWHLLGLLVGSSSLLYLSGMVLNDVFDQEQDTAERPHRPIPSGRIPAQKAAALGWSLLMLGMALGWLTSSFAGGYRSGVVASALALCIVLYDKVLKATPVAPLFMGGCRFLNVLLGMSVAAEPFQTPHYWVAGAIGTYIVGVTWFARTEAKVSNRFSLAGGTLLIAGGIGMLIMYPDYIENIWPLSGINLKQWQVLMGALLLLIGWRCVWAVLQPTPERVQGAVKQCIMSLIVLDAAATLPVCNREYALVIIALLIPTASLGRWIYST